MVYIQICNLYTNCMIAVLYASAILITISYSNCNSTMMTIIRIHKNTILMLDRLYW